MYTYIHTTHSCLLPLDKARTWLFEKEKWQVFLPEKSCVSFCFVKHQVTTGKAPQLDVHFMRHFQHKEKYINGGYWFFLEVTSLQSLRLCSRYFISTVFPPFLVLKQLAFYWAGCRGQAHTHTELIFIWEKPILCNPVREGAGHLHCFIFLLSTWRIPTHPER